MANEIRQIEQTEYAPVKEKVDEVRAKIGLEKLPTLEQEADREMSKLASPFSVLLFVERFLTRFIPLHGILQVSC